MVSVNFIHEYIEIFALHWALEVSAFKRLTVQFN